MVERKRGDAIEARQPKTNEKIGLPYRPFLFTLDQISSMLNISVAHLEDRYVYFDGRTTGIMSRNLMLARDIAPQGEKPEWRIAERELLRWMKRKGFRHYEGTVLTH